MTFEEKYNLVPTEFKTASQIGLAAATLGAMVRRGLVEATNTSPKQYRKSSNPAAKLYILIEQNKDDFDTYFTLRKSNQKLGMLCSTSNNTILDCLGNPYDLTDVNRIEFRTKHYDIQIRVC